MAIAERNSYLADIVGLLNTQWPENRIVNIVCHGHSVPAGYFATPYVDTFNAYPHLLHLGLKRRFPYAVVNVIVSAVGGENSATGASRFDTHVLTHRPDLVIIDYGLNDRGIGLQKARTAWEQMVEAMENAEVSVILLTPTADITQRVGAPPEEGDVLRRHADQIRSLASDHEIGLSDSLAAFDEYQQQGDLSDLLAWTNHPNRAGHELVARDLLRWFSFG